MRAKLLRLILQNVYKCLSVLTFFFGIWVFTDGWTWLLWVQQHWQTYSFVTYPDYMVATLRCLRVVAEWAIGVYCIAFQPDGSMR